MKFEGGVGEQGLVVPHRQKYFSASDPIDPIGCKGTYRPKANRWHVQRDAQETALLALLTSSIIHESLCLFKNTGTR